MITHRVGFGLMALLLSSSVRSEPADPGPVTVCTPASAIRITLPEAAEIRQVRAAPAHGSCRNTAAPRRTERPQRAVASLDQSLVVCKPGSAIRYRVPELPEEGPWRAAGPAGSCRVP